MKKDYEMKFGKKSQMALEFLMTYGWAVLGSMAVIGVLTYLVISNPATESPSRCNFPAGLQCMGSQYTPNQVLLKIRNSLAQPIYSVRAVAEDGSFNCSVAPSPCSEDCIMEITCNKTIPVSDQGTKLQIDLLYKKTSNGYDQIAQGEVFQRSR